MGIQRDVELPRGQVLNGRRKFQSGGWFHGYAVSLALIGAHERSAAGVSEQDHPAYPGLVPQPPHAGADVDQRVFKQKIGLVASKAGVPAEKPVAAFGHVRAEIMLAEIDVVM